MMRLSASVVQFIRGCRTNLFTENMDAIGSTRAQFRLLAAEQCTLTDRTFDIHGDVITKYFRFFFNLPPAENAPG